MDGRIDEITKQIVNKVEYYIDNHLEETFALMRRMTQSSYPTRFFRGISESKFEILKILNRHFSKVYDEVKLENNPNVARKLNVDRISEEIDEIIKIEIRKGLNRLEYELPDILRDTYRGIDRGEIRQQANRIMNRVPEYFSEFRMATKRYTVLRLEEAKDEFIKYTKIEYLQKENAKKEEITRDPKVEELISKISMVHFQSRKLNNPEEFEKYTKLRTILEQIQRRGLVIDKLDQASKRMLTDRVNDYLTLVKNEKVDNNKFKPIEQKSEELGQTNPTVDNYLNRLNKKIETLEQDETLNSIQNEVKTVPDATIQDYLNRLNREIARTEKEMGEETKRGL